MSAGIHIGNWKGRMLRVIRPFRDFDGRTFQPGDELYFDEYNVFPYDDGYTFTSQNRPVFRLSGNVPENAEVLFSADRFVEPMAGQEA